MVNEPAGGYLYLALIGLALLAFGLRIYRIQYQSLWRDEVDAVIFATRDLRAILNTFTSVGENGPLYFLGLHGWIRLAGQSEFSVRFPSACFGTLAVLATYQLGRELVGYRVGLIGALPMAFSPYHIWYGQEAKMYALISFLAPLSLLILLRLLRGGRRWLWLVWAGLMVAFLYIHLFATMMALVSACWIPLVLRRRPRLTLPLIVAVLLLTGAVLPVGRWLLPAVLTPVNTGYYPYNLLQMVSILLRGFSMGIRPASGLLPVGLYALLLIAGVVPLARQRTAPDWPPARGVLLLVLYLCIPLLAIWLVSLRRPTFTDRYLIVSLPAFFLLIATGIVVIQHTAAALLAEWRRSAAPASMEGDVAGGRSGVPRDMLVQDAVTVQPATSTRHRRIAATRLGRAGAEERNANTGFTAAAPSGADTDATTPSPSTDNGEAVPPRIDGQAGSAPARERRLAQLVGISLVVLVVVASLPFVYAQSHNAYKADFRAATRYVEQQYTPDDLLVFLMPYVQRAFAYYHPEPVRTADPPFTSGMSAAQVDAAMRSLTAGYKKVELFLSETDFWDPQGQILAWMDRNGALRCRQEFAYIEVRCYELK